MAELSREKTFPAWEQTSSFKRVQMCITMLNVYGILPDSQAAEARGRLVKWSEKNPAKKAQSEHRRPARR